MLNPSAPRSYRWALVAAVIISFQVALRAAFDVQEALSHDAPASMVGSETSLPGSELSPIAQRQVFLASVSGYQSALEGMLPARIATSIFLALSAGAVFFLAMRLRMSQADRPTIAHQLGSASLVAAVLRSIDGAENLVITRNTAEEMAKALRETMQAEGLANGETLASTLTSGLSFGTVAWTFAMVASFVTIGTYFRSDALGVLLAREEP